MRKSTKLAVSVVISLVSVASLASPTSAASWWQPHGSLSWQMQFSGHIDSTIAADAYDLDAFETSAGLVERLRDAGRRVVCYVNAGAWENWRPDKNDYPTFVKGKPLDGWPGERWLDIRRLDVLGPRITNRLDMCATKGFDAVEFDNVDGYSNDSGFPLTVDDQLTFDRWLAEEAHAHGLGVGLKNTLSLAVKLEPRFDFAILEQCFQYRECDRVVPFLGADKPVLDIEYKLPRDRFCAKAGLLGLFAMRKHLQLDAWRKVC